LIDSLYIAWKYISFYRARTAILVSCVTLIAIVPLTLELLLSESERQLLSRADSTPMLLGAKGSSLDLVMNSLYFDNEAPALVSMGAVEEIDASGLGVPVPLYVRFQARGFPIVGTNLDYLEFRGLELAQGRQMAMLGEAVIGAEVAERLELAPGDSLMSSPETLFDLAGIYPLKMKVAGVLSRSYSQDDFAVLVDVKTTWVVQGLVHGHEDLGKIEDKTIIIKRAADNVIASAKLVEYKEVTPENIDSFHFHGTADDYPLTAVLVLPNDKRSGTILRGRYLDTTSAYQIVLPSEVIDALLDNIFRIKRVLDAVVMVVGISTVLALVLVFSLSLRLRQREMNTVFRIGGSRSTTARLVAAEIVIILLASGSISWLVTLLVDHYSNELVRHFITG
jgi:putative ABC transport system permease protein